MLSEKQRYIEYDPPLDLNQYLYCYWSYQATPTKGIHNNKPIIPDGCLDIIFDLNLPTQSQCFIVGAMTRPIKNHKNKLFGIRFKPGMASSFQKMPINRLTDQIIDISSINEQKTSNIADRLAYASSYQEQANILNTIFRNLFPKKPVIEKEILHAIDSIDSSGGLISIHELAKRVGWSRQHLTRKFAQHTGITPKFFTSIVRVNKLIQKYKSNNFGFAEIAQECGYYDQAHMIKEFKTMTGLSPQVYFKNK